MEYYKSSKGYYYKKIKGKKTRISSNEYKKATQKQKGGAPSRVNPQVNNNNTIKRDVEEKREGLVYKVLNKILPTEIVSLFISGCGSKGLYKSKLKICYNDHETILGKEIDDNLSRNRINRLNINIKNLFQSIEGWKTYSSQLTRHNRECIRKLKRAGSGEPILSDYSFPQIPRNIQKREKFNRIFTPGIKQFSIKFFEIFKGIKIKSYCRSENLELDFNENNYNNPTKFCYVVQHPNGTIMSLQEFSKLFDNDFQYISNNAEYLYLNNQQRYISKYPFSGMTHVVLKNENGNLINKEYKYNNNIDIHYNDDDVYKYNYKMLNILN